MKKGMALITVIWILAILTVILGIVLFLTTSDIAYTFIFNSQRIAMASAEHGKNEVISRIPQYDLLGTMFQNDSLFYDGSKHPAFQSQIRGNRYFLIAPMPFPHGTMQWGTGGKWYKKWEFNSGGRVMTGKGDVEKVVNVGAAYEHPMTGGGGTDTNY
jgi:hypothetical protein